MFPSHDPRGLQELKKLKHIKSLTLWNVKSQQHIPINDSNRLDDSIFDIIKTYKNLKHLKIAGVNFTETGIEQIKDLTKISTLQIEADGSFWLRHLKNFKNLKKLTFSGAMDPNHLTHLIDLKKLKTLRLDLNESPDDRFIQPIRNLKSLKNLHCFPSMKESLSAALKDQIQTHWGWIS